MHMSTVLAAFPLQLQPFLFTAVVGQLQTLKGVQHLHTYYTPHRKAILQNETAAQSCMQRLRTVPHLQDGDNTSECHSVLCLCIQVGEKALKPKTPYFTVPEWTGLTKSS